ncbi:glycine betaine ABC transporter substrate-binding protein [Chromohalobacter canadensis]|uniref:glycine betaine ABC transporter substrate-binding protein n=1 Tax=Chromohalobacter canadensis TaxID=141389 RepID=UPI0021C11D86|nr:glycine betaine ABC transporter substrate-binding protein [Chromohalobacter canadensis]MCT8469358.1 glycine betaine ABC transporter substrate-binding protein [Chromohalobacter canadensis]MCT8471982.1 glycine betaine ABC transporter substrate-binding protein [Chromohalobacter canadensis]MCT8499905.1 glycine betaine ABC transporter substrate-binding protein [Chromohalobacter canadensis]
MKHPITALLTTLGLSLSTVATTAHAQDDPIVVGGLNYTEHLILTSATYQLLEANGYNVDKRDGLGTSVLRQAQENGQVDLYWEYTGNSVILFNDQPQPDNAAETYATAKRLDAEKGLIWLDPSDTNNTYALAMREADAEERDIHTLSDLAEAMNDGADLTLASNAEFYARDDGLRPLQEAYGFEFPRSNVKRMDSGLTYSALREGEVDVALVFATDGRNGAFDFEVLDDDQQFFPVYQLAPVVREETLDAHPDLKPLLNEMSAALNDETLIDLNRRVDVDDQNIERVAKDFLTENDLM